MSSVELPGHTARTHRLEDAKDAHEAEQKFRGRGVYSGGVAEVPNGLLEAVRSLIFHAVPCAVCRDQAGGRPATRRVFGMVEQRAGRQTAEVDICDDCEPPKGNVFRSYRWGLPFDLPYAGALRLVLQHLPPIEIPEDM